MNKYLLLFLCLLFFATLNAQNSRYSFGRVPASQLNMTVYEQDTSAAAAVLHDFGELKIVDSGSQYLQIFSQCRRLKILTKGGLDYGNIKIPYYSYKGGEKIFNLKAVVTLPNGETYELKGKEFFDEKMNKYWSMKKIALPRLEVGAVIDYYYKIQSEYFTQPREWKFQNELPVKFSQLSIDFDDRLSYIYLFQGFEGMEETKEGENTVLKDSISTAVLEKKTFTVNNVPALKKEPFITTIEDYGLRMRFQCSQYLTVYGELREVLSDWPTINRKLLENYQFGHQYRKKIHCGKIWNAAWSVLEKEMPPLEKATALYDFVNKNVENNGYSGKYVSTSLNEAFEKKKASKSEMNLMLTALLQKAGIESYPVLISTRDNGYPLPKYPILKQFNRTLSYVLIDGKEYFVECGNKLRPFGELSRNSMNRKGFLIKKSDGKWLDIVPKKSKKIVMSDLTINEEATITGKITANYTKTEASDNRWNWVNDSKEKSWIEELENTIIDFELDSVTVDNEKEISKPFKVHFHGDFSGAAQELGDFLYVNPFIFEDFSENPFKSERRQYPVDFSHPFGNQFIINLKYDTESYIVEELPKDAKLELSGKAVTLRYAAQEKSPGWIQITYAVSVNNPYIPVPAYEGLRTLFDMTAEKLGEQIVLKKL